MKCSDVVCIAKSETDLVIAAYERVTTGGGYAKARLAAFRVDQRAVQKIDCENRIAALFAGKAIQASQVGFSMMPATRPLRKAFS